VGGPVSQASSTGMDDLDKGCKYVYGDRQGIIQQTLGKKRETCRGPKREGGENDKVSLPCAGVRRTRPIIFCTGSN